MTSRSASASMPVETEFTVRTAHGSASGGRELAAAVGELHAEDAADQHDGDGGQREDAAG